MTLRERGSREQEAQGSGEREMLGDQSDHIVPHAMALDVQATRKHRPYVARLTESVPCTDG
jgi:hypothetical protein